MIFFFFKYSNEKSDEQITRKSIVLNEPPPILLYFFSSNTLTSLPWFFELSWSMFLNKRVPPLTSSKTPVFFKICYSSFPKNSSSTWFSSKRAKSTVLKFLKNRLDSLWSFLAKNSLPLPLSPFRKTNDSVLIIFFKRATVFFEQSDLAI